MSEQFNTPEQALIERLRRAPQPELKAEARQAILTRVLDAVDHPLPAPRPRLFHPVVITAIVVIIAAAVVAGVMIALSQQRQEPIVATVTVIPSVTHAPTATLLPTTPAPAIVITLAVTDTPTLTLTPTASPSPTLTATTMTTPVSALIIIEGPISKIDGNVITVYDTSIEIPSGDPVLSDLSVGDIVHVEGTQSDSTQIVIVAVTVVVINVDVNVNPSSGEVWRDDGNCSHPPPDWAPANGWRRRCQGTDNKNNDNGNNNGDNGNGNHNGNGNGNGNGDKHNKGGN